MTALTLRLVSPAVRWGYFCTHLSSQDNRTGLWGVAGWPQPSRPPSVSLLHTQGKGRGRMREASSTGLPAEGGGNLPALYCREWGREAAVCTGRPSLPGNLAK